ncbi:uncharacterized protein LOC121641551 [Xyrichtys novacula]|uniref:Uncharacterized protein LOC121641551 n=1 Tax=Xyrichtys novacula TaxID=13765 RepID=A0AAV1HQZ2_XYRNO|nr:uncharacterized protein LOC121641551 [Xyrichtys novacula]
MDPSLYKAILDHKTKGLYSAGIAKSDKNEIRRKAAQYEVEEYEISVTKMLPADGKLVHVKCGLQVSVCIVCQAGQQMVKKEVEYTPIKLDSSVEAVVGEEALSEDIERLEGVRAIVQRNVEKQQEKTRRRLQSGAPKTYRPSVIQLAKSTATAPPAAPASAPPAATASGPPAATASAPPAAPVSALSSALATPKYKSTSIKKYVKEAFAGKKAHVLLSLIGKYKLYFWDIERIGPNRELKSEVINAYLTLLVRDYNNINADKAEVIDSFMITAIWQGKTPRLRTLDPMAFSVIVGIVNEHQQWMLTGIPGGVWSAKAAPRRASENTTARFLLQR